LDVGATLLLLALRADSAGPPLAGARPSDPIRLRVADTCRTGPPNASACEIAAWSPASARLLVTSASAGLVPVAVAGDARLTPSATVALGSLSSVAVHGDIVAVCRGASDSSSTGEVLLLDRDLKQVATVSVGHGPDMLTFTPDGRMLLVANEAEPTEDGSVDHPGTVSIIDLSKGASEPSVRHVTFESFETQASALAQRGLHAPMPGRTMCQQLEPEYIAVSPDGRWAFVSMQEASAIAIVDVANARCIAIEPLGLKDFGAAGVGLDPSDKDGGPAIARWPIHGLYQPDTLACFMHGDELFVASANEGEPRDHAFWSEVCRISELRHRDGDATPALDPTAFPAEAPEGADPVDAMRNRARIVASNGAGRLQVSRAAGDTDGDGDHDRLIAFGGRSASLWRVRRDDAGTPQGLELAWDSGSSIERTVLDRMPAAFNADHDRGNSADARSDVRGPEPEGLAVADIAGRRILFVGLERCGGVIAWDISDPQAPTLATYANRRDPSVDAAASAAASVDAAKRPADSGSASRDPGDLGPEGILVIPASASPSRTPLLVLCNEVSGTLTVLEISGPHAH
jgi:hypothetical protein